VLPEEAVWLGEALADVGAGRVVLDVGSSTEAFRRLEQPHIDFHVMRPLRQRGARIVHVDRKDAEGVDVVHDVTGTQPLPAELRASGDVVLCANMFEHVLDRPALARRLEELVAPEGRLVVTVPKLYPFHEDPIDTMFRPSPAEVSALFPRFTPVREQVVPAALSPVRFPDGPLVPLARRFAREVLHRLKHRVRPPERYEVSAVVLQA
jgi:SAM-dependent methyltransferase